MSDIIRKDKMIHILFQNLVNEVDLTHMERCWFLCGCTVLNDNNVPIPFSSIMYLADQMIMRSTSLDVES